MTKKHNHLSLETRISNIARGLELTDNDLVKLEKRVTTLENANQTANQKTPLDQLRDQIADTIRLRALNGDPWTLDDLADAIITDLGLTAEHDYGTSYPEYPIINRRYTRYITDWTADA